MVPGDDLGAEPGLDAGGDLGGADGTLNLDGEAINVIRDLLQQVVSLADASGGADMAPEAPGADYDAGMDGGLGGEEEPEALAETHPLGTSPHKDHSLSGAQKANLGRLNHGAMEEGQEPDVQEESEEVQEEGKKGKGAKVDMREGEEVQEEDLEQQLANQLAERVLQKMVVTI